MFIETIAQTAQRQSDLLEMRRLIDALIDIDADPTGSPKEMAIRVGNTAIVQTEDDIQFWVGDKYITFEEFYQTVNLWVRLANGGRADEIDRRIPAGGVSGGTIDNATIRGALSGTLPITYSSITGSISIRTATDTLSGALSAADWSTFNSKQNSNTRLNAIVNRATPTDPELLTLTSTGIAFTGLANLGAIDGVSAIGTATPGTANFTTINVGTLTNPNNATINAVQATAGRAVFSLQAPANQTAASFLLRNSAGNALIAFRGGGVGVNGPGQATPSGGAIAIGDGTGAVFNVVGMRQTGFTTFLSSITGDKTITNPTTVAQNAAAIKAIYDALKNHGLVD